MATELEEAELTADDLGYIAEAQRIRAAMDRSAAIAAKRQQEAADRADREAAQMEAQQLIKDGATPQEVTRMLGHRLYRGATPRTQFEAMKFAAPPAQPQPPLLTNYNGQPFLLRQPGGMVPQRIAPAAVPPDVRAQQKLREQEISFIRRQMADPINLTPKADLTNMLKQAEAAYVKGSTNTGAASQQPAPFKDGTVLRNKKDKKLYRIENGVPVLLNE